jgi:uncharacterized protein (TIGR00251 family)
MGLQARLMAAPPAAGPGWAHQGGGPAREDAGIRVSVSAGGAVFRVRVVPRASRSGIAGIQNDALKLRITAPPVEGKANEECIRLLAETLVVWMGDFGRTPTINKDAGRDHRPPKLGSSYLGLGICRLVSRRVLPEHG